MMSMKCSRCHGAQKISCRALCRGTVRFVLRKCPRKLLEFCDGVEEVSGDAAAVPSLCALNEEQSADEFLGGVVATIFYGW